MPNPCWPLSKTMPVIAGKSETGSYHKCTPIQRTDIGKYVFENGVQSARRKYSQILKMEINESIIQLFRNQ